MISLLRVRVSKDADEQKGEHEERAKKLVLAVLDVFESHQGLCFGACNDLHNVRCVCSDSSLRMRGWRNHSVSSLWTKVARTRTQSNKISTLG